MKLGIFGGTFDPPHEGHVRVARAAREGLRLDAVMVVPSLLPPHREPAEASAIDRYAMVALALDGESRLVPSPCEIERGGVSYTIDTLRYFAKLHPADELVLVIGADSFDELDSWREAAAIRSMARLAVLPRRGSTGVASGATAATVADDGARIHTLAMPEAPFASRRIREALHRGDLAPEGLPDAVARYIRARGLYRQEVSRG